MYRKIFKRINPKKIKKALLSTAAFLVLLDSFANRLVEIVVRNGKGIAVWYFFIWFWAFFYAFDFEQDKA